MTDTTRESINKEAQERRRRFAAGDLKKAREYSRKALDSDGYLRSTYYELAANCYRNAYKWKRKADIPVFKET